MIPDVASQVQAIVQSEEKRNDFIKMPDDLIQHAFSFLDIHSLALASGTSKEWRAWIAKEYPQIEFFRMLGNKNQIKPQEVNISTATEDSSSLTLSADGKALVSTKNGLYLAETSEKLHNGDEIIGSNDAYLFCRSRWGEGHHNLFITDQKTLQTYPLFSLADHQTIEGGIAKYTFQDNFNTRQYKCRIEACYPTENNKFILVTKGGIVAHCSISDDGPKCDRWVDFYPGDQYEEYHTEFHRPIKWGNHLIFEAARLNENRYFTGYIHDLSLEEGLVQPWEDIGLGSIIWTNIVANNDRLYICKGEKSVRCVSKKIEGGKVFGHVEWEQPLPKENSCLWDNFIVNDKRLALICSKIGKGYLMIYDTLTGAQVLSKQIDTSGVNYHALKFQGDVLLVNNENKSTVLENPHAIGNYWGGLRLEPKVKYDPTLEIFALPSLKPIVWKVQKGDCAVINKEMSISILTAGKLLVYDKEKFIEEQEVKLAKLQPKPDAEAEMSIKPEVAKVPKITPVKNNNSLLQRIMNSIKRVFQAILSWIVQFWARFK